MKLLISNYLNEEWMFKKKLHNRLLWRIPYEELKEIGWNVMNRRELNKKHNIKTIIKKKYNEFPSVILYWFQSEYFYKDTIKEIQNFCKEENIICIGYIDDLHYNTNNERNEYISQIINGYNSCILSSYKYVYDKYHTSNDKIEWLPHCFYDKYVVKFNNNPKQKLLLTGVIDKTVYPMRNYVYQLMKHGQDMKNKIDCKKYPGYKNPKHNICGKKYIDLLNEYLVCFTCCSTTDTPYIISKFFEIPGSGSLLLAYDENIKDQLKDIGFIDGHNYISVTEENFVDKMNYVLDSKNRQEIDIIRYNGYELIDNKHLLSHRAERIDSIVNSMLGE